MLSRASIAETIKAIVNFAFPPKCIICGKIDETSPYPYLCSICYNDFTPLNLPRCTICGNPFTSEHTSNHPCIDCLSKKPYFESAISAGIYKGKLESAIRNYKYRKKRILYKPLSDFILNGLDKLPYREFDLVVPVPLSRSKLRERGFDQTYLLANKIAKHLHIPIDFRSLIKVIETKPQVEFGLKDRLENIKGSFSISDPKVFKGKKVLLVDDVYTSGSTLNECSKVLKREGKAKSVHCLTLARTTR